jgi:hypothetical protein
MLTKSTTQSRRSRTAPIDKIYKAGTNPHGQRFLAGKIPMVRGSQLDFTLNDHGEMSVFNFEALCQIWKWPKHQKKWCSECYSILYYFTLLNSWFYKDRTVCIIQMHQIIIDGEAYQQPKVFHGLCPSTTRIDQSIHKKVSLSVTKKYPVSTKINQITPSKKYVVLHYLLFFPHLQKIHRFFLIHICLK